MNIVVIGSGISGLSAAYYLKKAGHTVTLFESDTRFGGHTNTIKIDVENKEILVDTGFLVHNDRTYPNLIKFFSELSIPLTYSDMSLSDELPGPKGRWFQGSSELAN